MAPAQGWRAQIEKCTSRVKVDAILRNPTDRVKSEFPMISQEKLQDTQIWKTSHSALRNKCKVVLPHHLHGGFLLFRSDVGVEVVWS